MLYMVISRHIISHHMMIEGLGSFDDISEGLDWI